MGDLLLGQRVDSIREIEVAVVPVGSISEGKFNSYVKLMRKQSVVEIAEMTPRPANTAAGQVFPHLSRRGSMVFHFRSRYSDGAFQARRDDWEEFQPHRKIWGVIGILHCASESNTQLRSLSSQFRRLAATFPTAVAAICFGFEPLDDQSDFIEAHSSGTGPSVATVDVQTLDVEETASDSTAPTRRSPTSGPMIGRARVNSQTKSSAQSSSMDDAGGGTEVVMVPNGDEARLRFYIGTWLTDFAQRVQERLEQNYAALEKLPRILSPLDGTSSSQSTNGSSTNLATSGGSAQTLQTSHLSDPTMSAIPIGRSSPPLVETASHSKEIAIPTGGGGILEDRGKARKRKAGRLAKLRGDLALLAGSPVDALLHYHTALELSRSLSDTLWISGALEGVVAAAVLTQAAKAVPPNLEEVLGGSLAVLWSTESLSGQLSEAAAGYATLRNPLVARLEVESLLKLARFHGQQGARTAANEVLMRVAQCSGSSFSSQQELAILTAVAASFQQLGLRRKAALFTQQAARLYQGMYQPGMTHHLLQLASPAYGLPDLYHVPRHVSVRRDGRVEPMPALRRWEQLATAQLRSLLSAARQLHDFRALFQYATVLLRLRPGDVELLDELRAVTAASYAPPGWAHNVLALVHIEAIQAAPVTASLRLSRAVRADRPRNGPFIYTPLRLRGQEEESEDGPTLAVRGGSGEASSPLLWEEGRGGVVHVVLHNPHAVDLHVSQLTLEADGGLALSRPLAAEVAAGTSRDLPLLVDAPSSGRLRIVALRFCVMNRWLRVRFTTGPSPSGPEHMASFSEFLSSSSLPEEVTHAHRTTTNEDEDENEEHEQGDERTKKRKENTDSNRSSREDGHSSESKEKERLCQGLSVDVVGKLPWLQAKAVERCAIKTYVGKTELWTIEMSNRGLAAADFLDVELVVSGPDSASPPLRFALATAGLAVVNRKTSSASASACAPYFSEAQTTYSHLETLFGWRAEEAMHWPVGESRRWTLPFTPLRAGAYRLELEVLYGHSASQHQDRRCYRRLPLALGLEATVPVELLGWTVAPLSQSREGKDEEELLVAVDVLNRGRECMQVTATVQQEEQKAAMVEVRPLHQSKLLLRIPRQEADPAEPPSLEKAEQWLAAHVALCWKAPTSGDSGVLLVRPRLAPSVVAIWCRPRLRVTVTSDALGDAAVQPVPRLTAWRVRAAVVNAGNSPLDADLRLLPYQDHLNGDHRVSLDGSLMWDGALEVSIRNLLPGESFSHSACLLFLVPGRFLLQAVVVPEPTKDSMTPQSPTWSLSPLILDVL